MSQSDLLFIVPINDTWCLYSAISWSFPSANILDVLQDEAEVIMIKSMLYYL